MIRPRRPRLTWGNLAFLLIVALLIDVALIAAVLYGLEEMRDDLGGRRARPVRLVIIDPPARDELEAEEPEPEYEGQIVEIAPDDNDDVPEEADYLADRDNVTEEETKTKNFKMNPDLLARTYSREEQMKTEQLVDVNMTEESTGAMVGNDRFDPDRDGTLASLPSPWAVTNKEGMQAPTVASMADASLAGAPQNDSLDERVSDRLSLNTKEFKYADYIKRIRRQVNFYWFQNLDNLPSSVVYAKTQYLTVANVILDADGGLEMIEVTEGSGVGVLDEAVVSAFKLASPFPNPPEGLISKDGRVYLPDFGFDVQLGVAKSRYDGIDPRANVQFPGILKSPR